MSNKEQLIKNKITEWLIKQGHNRCWYYPEIFNEICKILDIKVDVDRNLPPRKEFRENCRKYEDEQYLSPEQKLIKDTETLYPLLMKRSEELKKGE